MGRRRQKLDLRLDLRMLTVEMTYDDRQAQPWIFFGVNGDERAWVWLFRGDETAWVCYLGTPELGGKTEDKGVKTERSWIKQG